MKNFLEKKLKKVKKEYIILFLVTLFIYMPFLSMNFALGHDAIFHLTNVDAITKMIVNLNFTKITPYLANDFGYGTLIFYPPLPHLITAIFNIPFYIMGKSTIYSFKIVYFIITFLSGLFMYKLSYLLTKNKNVSLLTAVMYITMPYYLCDIFMRSAYNETFIFLFMPMIFIGLISLLKEDNKSFYTYFILGYIGIINSHLVLSVYFTILVLLFMLPNINKYLKNIKQLIIASIIILIIIIPDMALLIQHKNLNIYTVFYEEYTSSSSAVIKNLGLTIKDYIIPRINQWDLYHFINIIPIIMTIFGVVNLIKEKNKDLKIYTGIIIFMICSFILSLKVFPYQYLPKILMSLEFAYRNEAFVIFSLCIISGYGLLKINKKYHKQISYAAIIILCICAAPFINKMNMIKDNYYQDFGIASGMGAHQEYLPLNGIKNLEYFYHRNNEIIILKNKKSRIKIIENRNPNLVFSIKNTNNKKTEIELPRIYYLGYKITEKTDSKITKLDYKISKNGFIKLNIKKDGKIYIRYKGTTLYNILNIFRIVFIISTVCLILYKKKRMVLKREK